MFEMWDQKHKDARAGRKDTNTSQKRAQEVQETLTDKMTMGPNALSGQLRLQRPIPDN